MGLWGSETLLHAELTRDRAKTRGTVWEKEGTREKTKSRSGVVSGLVPLRRRFSQRGGVAHTNSSSLSPPKPYPEIISEKSSHALRRSARKSATVWRQCTKGGSAPIIFIPFPNEISLSGNFSPKMALSYSSKIGQIDFRDILEIREKEDKAFVY